ncbi:molybdopterin-dependent oxidoreductase FAD-binding subunit, partial [Aeromonas veronii]
EIACQQQDSPLLPVLLVLEAVVVLENNQLQPIDAYLAGQRNALVLGVVLPEPALRCATRRISRNADGLAVMTAAVALDALGEMRVAVAGVTP